MICEETKEARAFAIETRSAAEGTSRSGASKGVNRNTVWFAATFLPALGVSVSLGFSNVPTTGAVTSTAAPSGMTIDPPTVRVRGTACFVTLTVLICRRSSAFGVNKIR